MWHQKHLNLLNVFFIIMLNDVLLKQWLGIGW